MQNISFACANFCFLASRDNLHLRKRECVCVCGGVGIAFSCNSNGKTKILCPAEIEKASKSQVFFSEPFNNSQKNIQGNG